MQIERNTELYDHHATATNHPEVCWIARRGDVFSYKALTCRRPKQKDLSAIRGALPPQASQRRKFLSPGRRSPGVSGASVTPKRKNSAWRCCRHKSLPPANRKPKTIIVDDCSTIWAEQARATAPSAEKEGMGCRSALLLALPETARRAICHRQARAAGRALDSLPGSANSRLTVLNFADCGKRSREKTAAWLCGPIRRILRPTVSSSSRSRGTWVIFRRLYSNPGARILGESDIDFAADADFAVGDTRKATKGQDRTDKRVPGRFYLTMPDTAAFEQLLNLWEQWETTGAVSRGLAPFAHLQQLCSAPVGSARSHRRRYRFILARGNAASSRPSPSGGGRVMVSRHAGAAATLQQLFGV